MIRWLLLTGWLSFSAFFTMAQAPALAFRHLTTNDGLSDGKITSIGQDPRGFMWFATEYGLNRYDGFEVQRMFANKANPATIDNNQLRRQLTTSAGHLYFTSVSGFTRYRPDQRSFERHPFGISGYVQDVCETEPGELWLFGEEGLMRIEEQTGQVTRLSEHPDSTLRAMSAAPVLDLAYDGQGILYVASRRGLYTLELATLTAVHYRHDPDDPTSLVSNDVRVLAIDQTGSIWIGTDYYGSRLSRFDPRTGRFDVYTQFHTARADWADNRIIDLLVDRSNRLWIASLRAGVALYDREADDFHYYLHDPLDPQSLASSSIMSLFEDRDGAIWIGTEGYGVDYIEPDKSLFQRIGFASPHTPTLADPWCRAIVADHQGDFWIGTYKGVSRYTPATGQFTTFLLAQVENSPGNNSIRSLAVDERNVVWVGTGGGLNRYDRARGKMMAVNEADGIPLSYIAHLLIDSRHNLWVSTQRGLFVRGRADTRFRYALGETEHPRYREARVWLTYEDSRGDIWISLPDHGLLRYDPVGGDLVNYPMDVINPDALQYDLVTSLAEDGDGIMWLTTLHGLFRHDPAGSAFERVSPPGGFPSNKLSGLLLDSLNRLWIGTSQGLCLLEADRTTVHTFDTHDGLPTNFIYEGTAFVLPDGRFAYPTYNGIVLFDPESIQPQAADIPVYVTAVTAAGAVTDPYSGGPIADHIRLGWADNFFTIDMTAIHYTHPKAVTFAYKLDGFDDDWHTTRERRINYTNVPGGRYVFRYKAYTTPGSADVPERRLTLIVGTVFYKTWWFITAATLLLAALIIGFVRWRFLEQQRMHQLENRAQLLEKEKALVLYENLKQHLNPHFLFNSLASLKSLIRVDQKTAAEFLERMSRIYRYILKSRDHELVSLQDELAFAQTYIDLQQTRFRQGLDVRIRVEEDLDDRKIVPVTLQNLIENAIKHNQIDPESPLVIDIFPEDDYLVVRNNLQKKEFVETSNRQGLLNMQSLYRYLDPRPLVIEETAETFTVKIPLI